MRVDFRIAGSGGQGVISLAMIMANAYGVCEGHDVVQTQSYGAEARGGACQAALIVSDSSIGYIKVDKANVFIAFNETAFKKYCNNITEDAIVFVDSTFVSEEATKDLKNTVYSIPATDIATKDFSAYAANIVMLGFVAAKLGNLSINSCEETIKAQMAPKHIKMNIDAVRAGYERGNA